MLTNRGVRFFSLTGDKRIGPSPGIYGMGAAETVVIH